MNFGAHLERKSAFAGGDGRAAMEAENLTGMPSAAPRGQTDDENRLCRDGPRFMPGAGLALIAFENRLKKLARCRFVDVMRGQWRG